MADYSFQNGTYSYANGLTAVLQVSATKSADFTSAAYVYDAKTWSYFLIVAHVATAGTTLSIGLQVSDDASTWYGVDGVTLSGITTTTGAYAMLVRGPLDRKYVRVAGTVTGSYVLTVDLVAFGVNATATSV